MRARRRKRKNKVSIGRKIRKKSIKIERRIREERGEEVWKQKQKQ